MLWDAEHFSILIQEIRDLLGMFGIGKSLEALSMSLWLSAIIHRPWARRREKLTRPLRQGRVRGERYVGDRNELQ
jgi:hypothetical protein